MRLAPRSAISCRRLRPSTPALNIFLVAYTLSYFAHATRFACLDYSPSNEDILRAKSRTSGVNDIHFRTGGIAFTIVDVGGQRSERRKWLHCFDGVTSVLFVAALDEYDMYLEEESTQNRMQESLRLFSHVSSSQFFEKSSWILFLNKTDLLQEKYKTRPLHKYFSDAVAADVSDYNSAYKFIRNKYVNVFKGPGKLYDFATCTLDTLATEKLFIALRDIVVSGGIHNNEDTLSV